MKSLIIASAIALTGIAGLAAPSAQAANARHPYSNVNKSNDKGNNTGDSDTERLNSMALDRARGGSASGGAVSDGGSGSMSLAPGSTLNPSGNRAGTHR